MEDFNEGQNGRLASSMRKIDYEQFDTLVRMHLSFELELNADESDIATEKTKLKKWSLLNFAKKPKSTGSLQKEGEAVSLTEESINQLKELIDYLSKDECINQEGIFRRTGKLTRQQELKNALYQNLPLNLGEGRYTVHDCASVLKGFLADLSEPLLTDSHFLIHCKITEYYNNGDHNKVIRSLQLLLLLLPFPNRIVLKLILGLLNKTAAHENSNKMNCDSLATLFTPHLMCPRNLSPSALHMKAQQLSGLVAFMIQKGFTLYNIPEKLLLEINSFWLKQDKKMLSPQQPDPNESTADTTGTAHTVFSFVDHNLTAKATATQDTQAALAQLYAHIQSMPESAKKRRLVKQFNKENGQGTPRHVKPTGSAKSFGDSIKKRIFQKKLQKKMIDVKLGCNFSRSSSEENMVSNTSTLIPKMFSKSEDELSDMESYEVTQQENLVTVKHISNSTGSLNTPSLSTYKKKSKVILKSFLNLSERSLLNSPNSSKKGKKSKPSRFSRHRSEPPDMYSQMSVKDEELIRQSSESALTSRRRLSIDNKSPERSAQENSVSVVSDYKSSGENPGLLMSPATKSKLRCLYAAHTSTPSNLLRQSLANDYVLTPITDDDKSMSPITQSATKMTKAMQETMMTPRSRKPVVMISTSNLCGLANLQNGSMQYDSTNSLQSNFELINRRNYASIIEESPSSVSLDYASKNSTENKENMRRIEDIPEEQSYVTCDDEMYGSTIQKSASLSVTNTYIYPSRSVLTASPVDLSFTSRTGDFEQSESDLIIPPEEGNNPGSDTSGIASGSPNSANNSTEKIDVLKTSPRKRCTSLQRNDSKRSFKDESICDKVVKTLKQKQLSESTLNSVKLKESLPETSF